jgi:hypothetical protein
LELKYQHVYRSATKERQSSCFVRSLRDRSFIYPKRRYAFPSLTSLELEYHSSSRRATRRQSSCFEKLKRSQFYLSETEIRFSQLDVIRARIPARLSKCNKRKTKLLFVRSSFEFKLEGSPPRRILSSHWLMLPNSPPRSLKGDVRQKEFYTEISRVFNTSITLQLHRLPLT